MTLVQKIADGDRPDKECCEPSFRNEDCRASRIKLEHSERRSRYVVKNDNSDEQSLYKWSFRNIQDLKAEWTKLEPSESCSLRDVKFSTSLFFAGCLRLPPLIVDDTSLRKLLNVVAFETCPGKFQAAASPRASTSWTR